MLTATSSLLSALPVTKFFSHLFSRRRSSMIDSNLAFLSVWSLTVCSSACSRCFFFTRNRALAAVLRRRLSSSARCLDFSSSDEASFESNPVGTFGRAEGGNLGVEDVVLDEP